MRNNHAFISFTILFILVNLGLFVARFYEYWNFKNYDYSRNWWIIFARACGQGLNFTSMFILVLMLRHSITKLREMGLAVILPLDRHIYFHKVTGRLIVVYSLIHTVAHLGNLCKASEFWYFLSKNPSKHCFHEFFRLSWQSEIFCFENIFFCLLYRSKRIEYTEWVFISQRHWSQWVCDRRQLNRSWLALYKSTSLLWINSWMGQSYGSLSFSGSTSHVCLLNEVGPERWILWGLLLQSLTLCDLLGPVDISCSKFLEMVHWALCCLFDWENISHGKVSQWWRQNLGDHGCGFALQSGTEQNQ